MKNTTKPSFWEDLCSPGERATAFMGSMVMLSLTAVAVAIAGAAVFEEVPPPKWWEILALGGVLVAFNAAIIIVATLASFVVRRIDRWSAEQVREE